MESTVVGDQQGNPEKPSRSAALSGETLPIFPNITPDSIVRRSFLLLEDGDLRSEANLRELLDLMYRFSERDFYVVTESTSSINPFLLNAEAAGIIAFVKTEFFYFAHPNFSRDYVRINPERCEFDWERDVVAKGPMFKRTTLKLTESGRRQMDIAIIRRDAAASKENDDNPLILQPTFFGIGLDFIKLPHWLKRIWKNLRRNRS